MNDPNNFAANLKVLKQERQMSMTKFSECLQIPKSTLQSVMENGQTSLDTACRIADALNIPLSVLTNGVLSKENVQILENVLQGLEWYCQLEAEEQSIVATCLSMILEVLQK